MRLLLLSLFSFCSTWATCQHGIDDLPYFYSQGFNSLPSTGEGFSLPVGWSASAPGLQTIFRADSGASNAEGFFSLGNAGSADRALGAKSGSDVVYSLSFVNRTEQPIEQSVVSFVLEHWRMNAVNRRDSIVLRYRKTGQVAWSSAGAALPKATYGPRGRRNGNAPANQTFFQAMLPIVLQPGDTLHLRFADVGIRGENDVLGIDDVKVFFGRTPPVPAMPIAQVSSLRINDAEGRPLMEDSFVAVSTVATSGTWTYPSTGSKMFFVADATGQLAVVADSASLFYEPIRGDSLFITGRVGHIRGHLVLFVDGNSTENVRLLKTKQMAPPPLVSEAQLDEAVESRFVEIDSVRFLTAWPNHLPYFDVTAQKGNVNFQVRIFSETDLFGRKMPEGYHRIRGHVLQDDPTVPFINGYKLVPQSADDLLAYQPEVVDGIPLYDIREINKANLNTGIADSLGLYVRLQGLATLPNIAPPILDFNIQDRTGGIAVYSDIPLFGNYQPLLGDSMTVIGTVQQHLGNVFVYADSIYASGTADSLWEPQPVVNPGEREENRLVTVHGLHLENEGLWMTAGQLSEVPAIAGEYRVVLRFEPAIGFAGLTKPDGLFSAIGVVRQFDSAFPYTSNYQILIREASDIGPYLNVPEVQQLAAQVFPNPFTHSFTVSISVSSGTVAVSMLNMAGQEVWAHSGQGPIHAQLGHVPPGVYVLRLKSGSSTAYHKVVKQ